MEYKIYNLIRNRYKIPLFIRLIFSFFLGLLSVIPIFLPIFPWSLFVWVFMMVLSVILLIPADKIKHLIKIRKWIFYFFKNLRKDSIVKHKMKDISIHVKAILDKRKEKRLIKRDRHNIRKAHLKIKTGK